MNEQEILVPPYTDPIGPAAEVPWWSTSADLLLKLALVLVLIYICLWLLRRFTQPGASRPGAMLLGVVEQMTLAPGRSIYLIELGNRLLVIGSTANQLSTLAEIVDPVEVAEIQRLRQSTDSDVAPFAIQLRSILERRDRRSAGEASGPAQGTPAEGPRDAPRYPGPR